MFWTDNINELIKPVLIPTDYMSFDEKLNALTRLIIFIIYNYQSKYKKDTDTFLNEKNLDIVQNKICIKPTKDNPFMNPNIIDISSDTDIDGACSISDKKINDKMSDFYETTMFQNVDDIYNTQTSSRQFYTVPSTKIPNDQSWLYNRGPSCKENNGIQCYNNLYRDLRI